MVSGRCSARPAELVAYARETDDVVALLRSQLLEFEARVQWLLLRSLARIGGDPTWETTRQLDDLASWVAHVGWAFAVAGGAGDATVSTIVDANPNAVDHALGQVEWNPSDHLIAGAAGAWFRALNPACVGGATRGYRGDGF